MKHVAEWARKITTVVLSLYVILLALLTISQFLLPPEYGDLTRSIVAILLLVTIVFLPLSLFLRLWRLAGLLLIPFFGFIVIYGAFLLPRTAPNPTSGKQFTLLTFNLQAATDAFDSLSSIIETANADIVTVQELSYAAADHFHEVFQERYRYQALFPQDNAHTGQGVLSRYPILAADYWRNEQLEATLGHERVELDLNGTAIILYNTHPVPAFSFDRQLNLQSHSAEILELLERASAETAPVMLAGDFNMSDQFDEYQRITSQYRDSFREAGDSGFGFTFPNGSQLPLPPLLRLDYVFHDPTFQAVGARVWEGSGSSDHLPVFVELVWTG